MFNIKEDAEERVDIAIEMAHNHVENITMSRAMDIPIAKEEDRKPVGNLSEIEEEQLVVRFTNYYLKTLHDIAMENK